DRCVYVLYVLSVWIHILAAATWIGGMLFLVLVVVPWLRGQDRARAAELIAETGIRFRRVGWTCFALVGVTGTFNLWVRAVRPPDLVNADWLAQPFGRAVAYKLATFALVLIVSAVHDFGVGPRAARAVAEEPGGARAQRLRRMARGMGRLNVLLALVLVAL